MRKRFFGAAGAAALALMVAGGTAKAADLGYEGPRYNDLPMSTFAGWYFGATLGYSNADIDLDAPTGVFNFDADGLVGGGLGGYNWQYQQWVLGVEGELLGANLEGEQDFGPATAAPQFDYLASLRARVGYVLTPQVMLFGTLGGAFAGADLPVFGPGGAGNDETFFGYQVGGGAEVALSQNWTARFDYTFTDLDSEAIDYPGGTLDYDPDLHTVKGSLLYRF